MNPQNSVEPDFNAETVKGFTAKRDSRNNPFPGNSKGGQFMGCRGVMETALFILGFLSLAFLLLGIISFSNPRYKIAQQSFSYVNSGNFTYAGNAPDGIYDSSSINTGDPIFLGVTCQIFVQFDYLLSSDQLQNIAGNYQMIATVMDPTSGWQRKIPLQSRTDFTGNSFSAITSINLCEIAVRVDNFEIQTNLHPFIYSLLISPNIQFSTDIDNKSYNGSFNPSLSFQFDKVHAYLNQDNKLVSSLHPTEEGMIQIPQVIANTISIFGLQLQVPGLRTISVLGILFSVAVLSVIGIYALRIERKNQTLSYQMKYGLMMIEIHDNPLKPGTSIIDMVSMDDLARLADRSNSVIMHQQEGMRQIYYVQGNQNLYRFISESSSDMGQR
jgi:hypothetical protein